MKKIGIKTDVAFRFVNEATFHPVCTVEIQTPDGVISVMAEPQMVGNALYLRGFHIQGEDILMNDLGAHRLRNLAEIAMEEMECHELVVEGAVRTTGAGRGRTLRPIRFTRRDIPAF
ncbi:hypothetical protein HGP16_02385 [Rhizobium sp. P40RR-XXII]|uniref:hypothetical protein n=1 Tax=unclassified Rhizobium TaxID=2613769 RepID=UPI001456DF15|nr:MULTISPECIES: hypothetical protein [unclassified Rhizobium]NLR83950.1 hypothetical protein [Rhizobium sp. P28RR-XV]NLS15404.1 hypothetical protein [Rhizobium sp. P40RR-XXII]